MGCHFWPNVQRATSLPSTAYNHNPKDICLFGQKCLSGKTTEEKQPQYFVDGRGRWQGKKGRKTFCGGVCGKWGIVLSGVKSLLQKDNILLPHCHLIHRSLST